MASRERAGWAELLAGIGIMLIGSVILLRPLIKGGLGRAPGDFGDSRFIHYLLEHSWQWISRNPNHPLWDPPFYFPVSGVGAFSDLMAGAGPLYWPWRLAGMNPGDAYAAWIMTIAALNIASAFVVFWKCFRFSPLAAAVGATFLGVAAPLQNQSNHPQMLPQFYVMGMLAGGVMLVRSGRETTSAHRRTLWSALAVSCFVLQMYTAFYYAWFAMLACAITLGWCLVTPETLARVAGSVRLNWRPLLASAVLGSIALVPWSTHYLGAARVNPSITYEQM